MHIGFIFTTNLWIGSVAHMMGLELGQNFAQRKRYVFDRDWADYEVRRKEEY